ncbi:MAG TPA: Xaa-Pro peptidase family protein [Methanoregulaceae archaeon]|nr:Xaa-Pro peptidase family protein [Methanoregulaceae archaeon]
MELLDRTITEQDADAYVAFGSSQNPDIRYLTRFRTEDPVLYIKKTGKTGTMVVSQMEYERASRESIATIMSRGESGLLDYLREDPRPEMAYAKIISVQAGKKVLIPGSFPYGIGYHLSQFCEVVLDTGTVGAMRAKKSAEEMKNIRTVQSATDIAMEQAVSLIQASKPKKGVLFHNGKPLTSETVRSLMHKTLMDYGCHAIDTIVSCGRETALPHVLGTGSLLESEPIVIDTFPAHDMTGYYTDMTRTVVKGEPSADIIEMYDAVREAQDLGMSAVRPAAKGSEVHQAVVDFFRDKGFESNTQGFTHNLGHGVGLEVHELPTLGPAGKELVKGNVITVEPGLYYRGKGGIRLENTGAVTGEGFRSFTKFPREFILG